MSTKGNTMGFLKTISMLILLSSLAACGGGSGGGGNVDTTAPSSPSNTMVRSSNLGVITVTGQAEANSTVTVMFPDGTSQSVVAASDGSYSVTNNTPQSSGTITVTSTDSAGNVSSSTTENFITSDSTITTSSSGVITLSGKVAPNAMVTVTFPDGSMQTATADASGNFTFTSAHSQPFGDTTYASISNGGGSMTIVIPPTSSPVITNVSANANGAITIMGTATAHSTVSVVFPDGTTKDVAADANGNFTVTSVDSQPMGEVTLLSTDDGISSEPAIVTASTVEKALYIATGVLPELSFEPSVGINTEAPQGGVDTAGMPMPFVDIFRTARPFGELSPVGTAFDANGWPIQFADGINFARSKLLQGTLKDSIPEGQYTVLYEGNETLEFSGGAVSSYTKVTNENKYLLNISLSSFDGEDEAAASETNAININIRGNTSATVNTKNIRIIMPGGTCSGNPYIRVGSQAECPAGTVYESFESRLLADRNTIIFNPDYLAFLRNFKVIRMMNLMESSLKSLCFNATDCPADVGTWAHRAMLDDAVWGGNDGRTPDEEHKGVPIEVMVALANTLQRDIWVNMPHVANDDYIKNYAKYVFNNLDTSLKVYVEYSNEVWNPGFAGHSYAVSQGKALNLDTVPPAFAGSNRDGDYFARLRYYSQRAQEMSIFWKSEFGTGSNSRLIRVLGSFIGDRVLTEQMLDNVTTSNFDAVAIAPYFFGCPYEAICPDADKNLLTATTVDDIFDIIDQPSSVDVKSLAGTIEAVKNQLTATSPHNLKLVSYEGGQHLVTGVFGSVISETDKPRLRGLFNQANRDPRMKDRYVTFLNAWKDLADDGTTLFTLYTLPQSYYRFGNFGLKEHLNMSRNDSPKFDGVMTFQEAVKMCWWDNCRP